VSFYAAMPSPGLRQGDIVLGLPILEPTKRGAPIALVEHDYQVEVRVCHCAVITPCCSIEDGQIVLSPLRQLTGKISKHEVFGPEPLRINGRVSPEESTGPAKWAELSADEQTRRQAEGNAYVWLYVFVYDEHPLLPPYSLRGRETSAYHVDFRSTFSVKWDRIRRDEATASAIKVAELAVESRKMFRDKLAYFFGRAPAEDSAVLAALR